jgi:hypothetical protein
MLLPKLVTAHETTELVDRKALKRLGRYAIAEELARGGMAQLYVARKDGARELCVLKRLLFEFETDEIARARFQREAHVASYLSHPNIVRTIDAGFEGGTFCIASELVAGNTLEAVLMRLRALGRSLPPEAAIAIALKVLDALAYAHDLRGEDGTPLEIVHRDISPRNILLDFGGEVKIIDFGVARGKLDQFRTAPGVIVGSLEYMSPEQASALPVDRRSDIYSMAVVTYEMLTGRYLVPRDGQLTDALTAIVRDVPPPISSIAPHLSPAFDPVLARALAKDSDARYRTAREFHSELAHAAVGIVLAPAPIIGMMLREIMPEEEGSMLSLIERAKRALDDGVAAELQRPPATTKALASAAKYEPTALVERPRAGRVRQISVTAVDEPPVVGTKLGNMVLDMPGDSLPPGRTAFESLRRTNKKLFYSLIGLSAVAVLLLVAVAVAMFARPVEPPIDYGVPVERVEEQPAVVARAGPGVKQQKRVDIGEEVDREIAERAEQQPDTSSEQKVRQERVRRVRSLERSDPPVEKIEVPAPAEKVEEPAETPKPDSKAPYPQLRKWITQLRASPSKDNDTYYRLVGGIETAMSTLPGPAQKRIQSELNAATLTYDVEAVGRALAELMKAHANAP